MTSIQIAGTNGKGSVAVYLDEIFRAAGRHTGLFTSPHILDETERVRVDGAPIQKGLLHELMRPFGRQRLFCAYTMAARAYFARMRVDVAVYETGLGGRRDPVSRLPHTMSVLTRIGMDHMQVLGESLEEIAREKAGILQRGVPVVCLEQRPDAMREIVSRARELCCPLTVLKQSDVVYLGPGKFRIANMSPPLVIRTRAVWQPVNAALAAVAAHALGVGWEEISRGLSRARIPCRFEQIRDNPVVLVDVAHNVDAANMLAKSVRTVFPGRSVALVTAIMRDKDYAGVARCFSHFDRVFCVHTGGKRGLAAEDYCRAFVQAGARAQAVEDVGRAVLLAEQYANETGGIVVVAGSFTLAEQVVG